MLDSYDKYPIMSMIVDTIKIVLSVENRLFYCDKVDVIRDH